MRAPEAIYAHTCGGARRRALTVCLRREAAGDLILAVKTRPVPCHTCAERNVSMHPASLVNAAVELVSRCAYERLRKSFQSVHLQLRK